MNCRNSVLRKMKGFSREQIRFSPHAKIRMGQRQISESQIVENILKPKRLEYAYKQEINGETRYDCYFVYSNTTCHKYVLVFVSNIVVVTVVKIGRRWQKIIEKKQGIKK